MHPASAGGTEGGMVVVWGSIGLCPWLAGGKQALLSPVFQLLEEIASIVVARPPFPAAPTREVDTLYIRNIPKGSPCVTHMPPKIPWKHVSTAKTPSHVRIRQKLGVLFAARPPPPWSFPSNSPLGYYCSPQQYRLLCTQTCRCHAAARGGAEVPCPLAYDSTIPIGLDCSLDPTFDPPSPLSRLLAHLHV